MLEEEEVKVKVTAKKWIRIGDWMRRIFAISSIPSIFSGNPWITVGFMLVAGLGDLITILYAEEKL